jgi:hypothetical protein
VVEVYISEAENPSVLAYLGVRTTFGIRSFWKFGSAFHLAQVVQHTVHSQCSMATKQKPTMKDFLDNDDDEEEESWVFSGSHNTTSSSSSTTTMQRMSLGVGLLLGILLQCSLLGIDAYFISSQSNRNNRSRAEHALDYEATISTTTSTTMRYTTPRPIVAMDNARLFAALCTMLVSGFGMLALRILQSLVAAVARFWIPNDQDEHDPPRVTTSDPNSHHHDDNDTLNGTIVQLVTRPAACGGLLGVGGTSLVVSYCAAWVVQARLDRPDSLDYYSLDWGEMVSSALYLLSGVVLVWILYAPPPPPLLHDDVDVEPLIRSDNDTGDTASSLTTQPLWTISDDADTNHHGKGPMSIAHTEPECSQESVPDSVSVTRSLSLHWHLQWSSLLLGSMIGWLIQCASLSANEWNVHFQISLQLWHSLHQNPKPDSAVMVGPDLVLLQQQQRVVWHTCWAWWSLVSTTGMGIGLFLLVRSLLRQLPLVVPDDLSTVSKSTKSGIGASSVSLVDHKHMFVRVECCMVVGAVFGWNLAWTIAVYVLGMEKSHWYQSLWIVVGTMVWCPFVLYWYGSRHDDGGQVSRERTSSRVDGSMVV